MFYLLDCSRVKLYPGQLKIAHPKVSLHSRSKCFKCRIFASSISVWNLCVSSLVFNPLIMLWRRFTFTIVINSQCFLLDEEVVANILTCISLHLTTGPLRIAKSYNPPPPSHLFSPLWEPHKMQLIILFFEGFYCSFLPVAQLDRQADLAVPSINVSRVCVACQWLILQRSCGFPCAKAGNLMILENFLFSESLNIFPVRMIFTLGLWSRWPIYPWHASSDTHKMGFYTCLTETDG